MFNYQKILHFWKDLYNKPVMVIREKKLENCILKELIEENIQTKNSILH